MTTATLTESKNKTIRNFLGTARKLSFQMVPLSKLYVNVDLNNREQPSYSAENMEELKNSIRASGGIIDPLTVMPLDYDTLDGPMKKECEGMEFTVCDGFRRSLTLQELALEDPKFGQNIPIIITNTVGDKGVFKLIQAIKNLQRQNLSPMEIAKTLQDMINDSDISLTHQEVADAAGMKRERATQYLLLLKMPKEVKELLSNKKILFTHAREIMRAPQGENGAIWVELAKAAVGKTVDWLKRYIDKEYHVNATTETIERVTPDGKTQRTTVKSRKAKEVSDTYMPYFKAKAKEARDKKDMPEAAKWELRVDTLAWLYYNDNAQLKKDLEAWEKEREEKAVSEKRTKESSDKKTKYMNALVAEFFVNLNTQPDDLEAPRRTPAECYAATKKNLELQVKIATDKKVSVADHFGWNFPGVDQFMEEFKAKVKELNAKKKKAKAIKIAKDAWKEAFTALRKTDITAEDKKAAQEGLQKAIDDLKKFEIDPAEHEKSFLKAEEEKATADKAAKNGSGGKDKKSTATASPVAVGSEE